MDFARVRTELRAETRLRVILLHGDDAGLVRERADELTGLVTGGELLRLVDVAKDGSRDVGLLAAAASSSPLIGGSCAVRVRDAGDAFNEPARRALAGPGPGVVILEAPDLPGRSKLRAALEAAPNAAVVACWQERGAARLAAIGTMLNALGVTAEPAALDWLGGQLGDDRQLLRRECEKLAMFVGVAGRISLADAQALIDPGGDGDAQAVIAAAFAGDLAGTDRALQAAWDAGTSPVALLRGLLGHAHRLITVAGAAAAGGDVSAAIASLRPPLFFKDRASFERAARLWSPAALSAATIGLLRAERATKTTGMPDATIAGRAVLSIARSAASRR